MAPKASGQDRGKAKKPAKPAKPAKGKKKKKIDPDQALVLPAYDCLVKAAHRFNVLDARGAIGVTERQRFIGRLRALARAVAGAYIAQREALGYPLLRNAEAAQ